MGTIEEHSQAAVADVTWKHEAWVGDHLPAAAQAAEQLGARKGWGVKANKGTTVLCFTKTAQHVANLAVAWLSN
jgi:hypothetical protein